MAIEWPTGPTESNMTVDVPDNWPAAPAGPVDMLVASEQCNVNITWTVPPPYNSIIGGSFLLRAYVECLGPGQEMKLGPDVTVLVVDGQTSYTGTILIPGGTLKGEGELWNGVPVSGVYKIVAVLQHLNPGPTTISGFAEVSLRMFRTP